MYRKLKGKAIFDGYRLHSGKVLVLEQDTVRDIIDENDAGEYETVDNVICPGFINCHCHLELSHMKGVIPEHTGLVDFVLQVMAHRFNTAEADVRTAMLDALEEMKKDGIVAVGDICNTTDSLEIKKMKGIEWVNFVEVSGIVSPVAEKRYSEGRKVYEQFMQNGLKTFLVPHAPYSVSKELFQHLNISQELTCIHNQEARAEDELFINGSGNFTRLYQALGLDISFQPTGISSLRSWFPLVNRSKRIISVHNSFSGAEDVEYAVRNGDVFFCLCINANKYIENSIPPANIFPAERVVIGTDSLASNHSLSIKSEIYSLREAFPELSWETLLSWATINGARALGIDSIYGSFEKGKKPGLAFIDIKA